MKSSRVSLLCAASGALTMFVGPTLPVHAAPAKVPAYHLLRRTTLTGAEGWDYLFLDAQARRLYISRSTHVSVLNVRTGQVVGDIPNTPGVHGIAVDEKAGRGFTSNGRSNSVTIFDLQSLKKLGETPVGARPDAIMFEPTTQRVFTFNAGDNSATAIDALSGKVVGTVTLPGRPEFAVSDDSGEIYNNLEDKSAIVAFNARTLKVDHVWPLSPGEEPSGLAIDAKHGRLFAVCSNQKMMVLSTQDGKVVADLPIGNGPDACAFDPKRGLVFSPNGEDGTLTIFQQTAPDTYKAVTMPTQTGARTMALDPKTHHVFTIAAQTLPLAPGASPRRRGYVNGTVSILEFGPTN